MPSPWDTSYSYTTPGYANFGGGATPQYGTAATVNRFMSGQAALPFQLNLPGYGSMMGQRSRNVGSWLRGEVPRDVVGNIQQAGAERGIATGMTGGPNTNAAWLQALGLTSLGLQQQGAAGLSQAIVDTPVPELFNPMTLYVPERLAQQKLAAAQAGEREKIPWTGFMPAGPGGGYGVPDWARGGV